MRSVVGLCDAVKVRVAISKRRAKRLAAAVIFHSAELGWQQWLYTVCDGKVGPFGGQSFDTLEQEVADACGIMRTEPKDFVEIEENDVETFILKNSRNEWHPSQYKRVQRARCMKKPNKRI